MQAKAAIRAGFRKGNPRERSALGKLNNDGPDNRRVGKMMTSSVSPRCICLLRCFQHIRYMVYLFVL